MTARPKVVVVGAGPGGIAAARWLRRADVEIQLVAPGGGADHLPATVDVAMGRQSASDAHQFVTVAGVEVVPAEATAVSGRGIRIGDHRIRADAVIAAPGLALAVPFDAATGGERPPGASRSGGSRSGGSPSGGSRSGGSPVVAFWDPPGATAAATAIAALDRPATVAVVVTSLPYRCPPAPYGLAMQLARNVSRTGAGRITAVVTTPEQRPLGPLGDELGDFLVGSCADAGVAIHCGFAPDPDALAAGVLRSTTGEDVLADVVLVVPAHRRSPALAELGPAGPLVGVSPAYETEIDGLFVVGDAAASSFPRAADPAATAGEIAAASVLARVGLGDPPRLRPPEPECFVGHGDGRYSRLRLTYPAGGPPAGSASITIDGPSTGLAADVDAAASRWRQLRSEDATSA